MKKWMILLLGAGLIAACEQKETTVANPPGEKKESNTTIVKESPAPESKTETEPKTETETKSETNINVNPSPTP